MGESGGNPPERNTLNLTKPVRNGQKLTELTTLNLTIRRGLRGDSPKERGAVCAELLTFSRETGSSLRRVPFRFSQRTEEKGHLSAHHSQPQNGEKGHLSAHHSCLKTREKGHLSAHHSCLSPGRKDTSLRNMPPSHGTQVVYSRHASHGTRVVYSLVYLS